MGSFASRRQAAEITAGNFITAAQMKQAGGLIIVA
jgi:hypothetical protein